MIAVALGALAAVAVTLLVPIALWAEADGTLRPILETLPLGDAVAETRSADGQPILIAALAGGIVLAGGIALIVLWRRLVRLHLHGELSYIVLFGATFVMMAAILAAIALVPVLARMAAGADLRASPNEENPLAAGWAIAVATAAVLTFSFFALRRRIGKERAKPPSPEDLGLVKTAA